MLCDASILFGDLDPNGVGPSHLFMSVDFSTCRQYKPSTRSISGTMPNPVEHVQAVPVQLNVQQVVQLRALGS